MSCNALVRAFFVVTDDASFQIYFEYHTLLEETQMKIHIVSRLILLLFMIVVTTSNAYAALVMLDFEDLNGTSYSTGSVIPSYSQLSTQYLNTYGVSFTSSGSYVSVVQLGAGHATSGVNGIAGSTADGKVSYDTSNPIIATFFTPNNPTIKAVTNFISVRGDLWGSGQNPVTLYAYDISGNLISSNSVFDTGGETLTITANGIHSVKFIGTSDSYGVALDDMSFNNVTPTPIPPAFLLLGSGLIGLFGFIRRKHTLGS
jgi:hypothetical protein